MRPTGGQVVIQVSTGLFRLVGNRQVDSWFNREVGDQMGGWG